jgi:hypothetical protein
VKPILLFDLAGNSYKELATLVARSYGVKRKFINFKKNNLFEAKAFFAVVFSGANFPLSQLSKNFP